MGEVQKDISKKYGIDINKINLVRLYGISGTDLSDAELEQLISERKRKWEKSANGTNERLAARDRKYLENADTYEKILRDRELLKKLFDFYNKKASALGNVDSARTYFTLISKTRKHISRSDVNFFFEFYPDERANKKAVLDMLEKEFDVKGAAQFSETKEPEKTEGNKKAEVITASDGIVVNLFQKDTVLDIKKYTDNCKTVSDDEQVCRDYPELKEGMYEFLKLDEMNTPQAFSEAMSCSRSSVYDRRQEKGHAYDPLVDFYNGMSEMSRRKDVQDNFGEFKLLVKYPALTPYMYEAETVDENTLEDFFVIACNEYDFYDLDEFLSEYFLRIYDNFNIDISKIQDIIRKAGERNKFFTNLNRIVGFKTKLRTSGKVNIIHWLLYWPITLLFLLFELVYAVTKAAKKSMTRNFFAILAVEAVIFPLFFHQDSLLTLFWPPSMAYAFECQMGISVKINLFTILPLLVINYAVQGLNYVLPALFFSLLLYDGGRGFYKKFDWIGIERTFKNTFKTLSRKTEEEYAKIKEGVVAKYVPGVIANLVSLGVILFWVFSK